jgi:predicted dehydrogenase
MNRRIFIRNAALGTAGLAAGASAGLLSSCSGRKSSGELILALIGCGGRGTELALQSAQPGLNTKIKYVCDVNAGKSKQAAELLQKSLGYLPAQAVNLQSILADKEVDAVIIATPDHWHALATVKACQAKKDVYVESNPSLSIWEGRKMQEAAKKYNRVVQAGFQHRSAGYMKSALEYVKAGELGQVVHIKTYSMRGGAAWQAEAAAAVPQGLDWNAWLGPAPETGYNPGIADINVRGGWTNYWAYSGGILGSRASHLLDMARMIMGDPDHPRSVYCWGGNKCFGSGQEVPEMQAITYHYDKFTLTCETGIAMGYMQNKLSAANSYPDWMRTSERVEVYGTKGLMYIGLDGRGWQVINKGEVVSAEDKGPAPLGDHITNFISCVRSGKEPAAGIAQGHLSASLVHMGNISCRTGNLQLAFDNKKEAFVENSDANQLLKTSYREGYSLPDKV